MVTRLSWWFWTQESCYKDDRRMINRQHRHFAHTSFTPHIQENISVWQTIIVKSMLRSGDVLEAKFWDHVISKYIFTCNTHINRFWGCNGSQWNIILYGTPSAVQYALVNCEHLVLRWSFLVAMVKTMAQGPYWTIGLQHGYTPGRFFYWNSDCWVQLIHLNVRDIRTLTRGRVSVRFFLIFSNATSMLWSSECTRKMQKVLYCWTDNGACVPTVFQG